MENSDSQTSGDPYREPLTPSTGDTGSTGGHMLQERNGVKRISKDEVLLPNRTKPVVQQKALVSPEDLGQQIAGKISARAAFAKASGAAPSAPPETTKKIERPELHAIRTYRGDVEDTVQTKNISMISVVAAEEDRKAKEQHDVQVKKRTVYANIAYVIGSIVLLFGGTGAVYVAYEASLPRDTSVPVGSKDVSLIFTERTRREVLQNPTRESLMALLLKVRTEEDHPLGTFERIFISPSSTSTDDIQSNAFLRALGAEVSSTFVRSLDGTMLIGLHSYGETVPFIMFRSQAPEQTFREMLRFEPTLRTTLHPFIPILATSTIEKPFEDAVIRNKDARVVRDESGEILFLYAFPDEKTLVITRHPDTLVEIIRRMVSTKNIGT